ncbi:MAG: TetR/AcrR family transcriptional regulator [Solirubrobacterales bacterium]
MPIYARLPKGPHSIGATGVAHNQRIRMHGGMIEAVTTRGYEKTSVRLVIGLAGVSRRAFYEQFSGKEACFMATFDLIVNRAVQRLTHAYRTAEGRPERRLRVALEALGSELEQNPKALHLVLIDAQTAGPEGLRRLHRALALCEGLFSRAFSDPRRVSTDRSDALPLPVVRAIVGGLRRATSMRLRDGETEDLGTLTKEMLKWSLLFNSPAARELRPRACANPPFPAAPKLEPDACGGGSTRARLLRSAIELWARSEKPEELSSLRIADDARLPIEAFIDLFPTPEACYLEALDVLGDELLQLAADPGLVSAEWPAAVCRTVDALLARLAESPPRLVTLAAKAFEAGPPAIASVGDLAYEIATLLTEGAPRRPRSRIAVEGIAGALWHILYREAVGGRGHRLPVLSEYISYVVLTPYLGPEAAMQAIAQARPAESAASQAASAAQAQLAGTANGKPLTNGTPVAGRTPATNGAHSSHGTPRTNGNGVPATNGTHSTNGKLAAGETPNGNGTAATNGTMPADEDYRRLAERRSAKCVNTTPTSTESTITTIKGT